MWLIHDQGLAPPTGPRYFGGTRPWLSSLVHLAPNCASCAVLDILHALRRRTSRFCRPPSYLLSDHLPNEVRYPASPVLTLCQLEIPSSRLQELLRGILR